MPLTAGVTYTYVAFNRQGCPPSLSLSLSSLCIESLPLGVGGDELLVQVIPHQRREHGLGGAPNLEERGALLRVQASTREVEQQRQLQTVTRDRYTFEYSKLFYPFSVRVSSLGGRENRFKGVPSSVSRPRYEKSNSSASCSPLQGIVTTF
jgi:hypothetical protein